MKKIISIVILFTCMVLAADKSLLEVYVKVDTSSVRLKWIPNEYSSKNFYKIYKNDKFLTKVKPMPYEKMINAKFSDDYIFMIYPFRDAKSIDEKILAFKAEKRAAGFRILKMMKDNKFSKNLGQFFEDKDVISGKEYTYKIEYFKNRKLVETKSIIVKNLKPNVAKGVFSIQAKNSMVGVSLDWDSGNTYAYYNVYRKKDDEKEFKKITKGPIYKSPKKRDKSSASFEDKALKKGEKATYYVKKLDMFFDEGKASYEVQGERLIYKNPPIVKNIFVKNRDNKITLRWKEIQKVLGYNIYRSTNYNGGYKKINQKPIKENVYFDRKFKVNQNYYYYITSINKHAESYSSTKMLAYAQDVTPPSLPKNLTFDLKAGVVNLKWQEVKDSNLLGYRIYMSMDKSATQWSRVTKKEIKGLTYSHKRPKTLSKKFYFYHVKAVDKNFNESASSNIVKVKLPDVIAPKQPKMIKFVSYPDKITLEWGKNLVYDFDHYNVYRIGGIKLNQEPLIRNYFVDKTPLQGLNKYVITAVDASGNESIKKEVVTIKLLDNTAVNVENFKVKKVKEGYKISFTCKDVDYNGFEVFRSNGKDLKYYNISSFQKAKSFIDKNIVKETVYYYMIKAYDKVGNIKESNTLSIKY